MKVYIYENLKDMRSNENYILISGVIKVGPSFCGGLSIETASKTYSFPLSIFAMAEEEDS